MDFEKITRTANLLSKNYALDFLKILCNYKDVSASEAASRLDLHIKTAQDFLEELYALEIVEKTEVYEKTRPYYRYTLKKTRISLELDLEKLTNPMSGKQKLNSKIKEKKESGVIFTHSGDGQRISAVTLFIGEGRAKKQQKILLTDAQGKFLFHLPFPTEEPRSILSIMEKSSIDTDFYNEILDLIQVLEENKSIEINS
jgi:predicted transcriptional regulator